MPAPSHPKNRRPFGPFPAGRRIRAGRHNPQDPDPTTVPGCGKNVLRDAAVRAYSAKPTPVKEDNTLKQKTSPQSAQVEQPFGCESPMHITLVGIANPYWLSALSDQEHQRQQVPE